MSYLKHVDLSELDMMIPFLDHATDYIMIVVSFAENKDNDLFVLGFVLFIFSWFCRFVGTNRYLAGRYEDDACKNTITNMFCSLVMLPCHSLPYIAFTMFKSVFAPVDWMIMLGYYSSSGIWRMPVSTLGYPFKKEIEVMERKYFRSLKLREQFIIGIGCGFSGTRGIVKIVYHAPFDDFDHNAEYSSEEFKREIALIALIEEILQNVGGILMSITAVSSPASIVSLIFTIISILYETGYLIGKQTKEGIKKSKEKQQSNV